jgi:phosphohistidine phosphatase
MAANDGARRLTAKGRAQARRVGAFCADRGMTPEVVLTSPLVRARQTAELVADAFASRGLVEVPWAACGMRAEVAVGELRAFDRVDSLLLVGHQPDLGDLAASLLGMAGSGALRVRKALLAGITFDGRVASGTGVLDFFLPVRLM